MRQSATRAGKDPAALFSVFQWQRYWDGATYPDLVKTVPHVAFKVDDLEDAIQDQKVSVDPNSPSNGVLVAFIEVNGAPVARE